MGTHGTNRRRRPSTEPTQAVLDAIRRIVQALRESSRQAEARVGLSGAQLFVLRTLAESPGLSLSALAGRTRTHQSSVSVVVARLAGEGLVRKRVAATDARRVELRLTPEGRRRLDRAPRAAQELLLEAVDALPLDERVRLGGLLDGLVRRMALSRQRPTMFFEEAARQPRGKGARRA